MSLATLPTPAALIDISRMEHNIARMQQRMDALGVLFTGVSTCQLAGPLCG